MKYSQLIQDAISFAVTVHKGQTRKGKPDVPYIIHPLSVGLILSLIDAPEEVITAGILHDTIEDCAPYGSVTKETLETMFGREVAVIVNDVTEQDNSLPWSERKHHALKHIVHMKKNSLLVKSADVLHNMRDKITDLEIEGIKMYDHFNAPMEAQLEHHGKTAAALKKAWPENPLLPDIEMTYKKLLALSKQD